MDWVGGEGGAGFSGDQLVEVFVDLDLEVVDGHGFTFVS